MDFPFFKKRKKIKSGYVLLDKGNLKEAERIFRECNYSEGLCLVAKKYVEGFKYKKAFSIYSEIKDYDGLVKLLEKFFERGNVGEMVQVIKVLNELNGEGVILAEKFGDAFLNEEDPKKAEKLFSILDLNRKREKFEKLFDFYLTCRDFSNAIRIARELGDRDKMITIGYKFLENEDFKMARKVFEEVDYNEGVGEVDQKEEEYLSRNN